MRFIARLLNPRQDRLMTINEHKMYVHTFDRMMAVVFWRISNSEQFEHDFMKNFVRPGMTVVDIGANIGYHTLQLARAVGPTGRVYAFEPDPENYRLLVKNIEVNGYQNVTAIQKAVADKAGTLSLYLCEENQGDHRIYHSRDGRKTVNVQALSLDEFFKGRYDEIDFIKIDTQGADCLVFEGMSALAEANDRLTIICEFVPYLLKKCGHSGKQLLTLIRRLGFKVFSIDDEHAQLEPVQDEKLIKAYVREGTYTSLLLRK